MGKEGHAGSKGNKRSQVGQVCSAVGKMSQLWFSGVNWDLVGSSWFKGLGQVE